MKRQRLRTAVLWGGCTLCVLMALLFVVSAWWEMHLAEPGGPHIGVHAGALDLYWNTLASRPGCKRHGAGLGFALVGVTQVNGFTLPLIYPFAGVAIPTLLVWRFWPKSVKPGHCRCGYDLQGNESGRCPECGVEVQA